MHALEYAIEPRDHGILPEGGCLRKQVERIGVTHDEAAARPRCRRDASERVAQIVAGTVGAKV